MALFEADFLSKLQRLALVARGGGLPAAPAGDLRGGGVEPIGHRDYSPGDDYRRIDWRICARHDELRTRLFQGEAERHVYLLLDCSASMGLGRPKKLDAARQAAAALAYASLDGLDCVSVLAFADRLLGGFGPLRDKSRFFQLAGWLKALSPQDRATDLKETAAAFVARGSQRGPAVVLSDFYDPAGFRRGLDVLRRAGYRPAVVRIFDPAEAEPSMLGDWELEDVESGLLWQATLTERHLERYRRAFEEHAESLRRYGRTYGVRWAEVACDLPTEEVLLRAVGARREGSRDSPATPLSRLRERGRG